MFGRRNGWPKTGFKRGEMTKNGNKREGDKSVINQGTTPPSPGEPGWAPGLRMIYDSVLHEPLPGNLQDLLSRLDKLDTETDGE